MELETNITLEAGVYAVQLALPAEPTAFSPEERAALARFGDMLVELGGDFSGESITFSLPADARYIPKQLPVKKLFALADSADAEKQANVFASTIRTRISDALETLMDKPLGRVGRSVTTLPL